MIEVCTVFAPRPQHPQWRDDYLQLIAAQRASALLTGHKHTVVTDADLGPGLETLRVPLPEELMPAMIAGVLARLDQPVTGHICFVDVDCLIERSLEHVFTRGEYDLGLTYRDNEVAPINNGVMYMRQSGHARAIMFFREALRLCKNHWGGDQEAISQAAAPVAHDEVQGKRSGATIRFLSSKYFAAVPKSRLARHDCFVVHFKGATKEWMLDYARTYHGWQEAA